MAGLSTVNPAQDLAKKFSFQNMKTLMDFVNTRPCESMAVQQYDASSDEENLETTGNLAAILNGQPIYLNDDLKVDLSGSTEETVTGRTAWTTGESFTAGDILMNPGKETEGSVRYRCIEDHTSRDNSDIAYICNEPGASDIGTRYWEVRPHTAVNANGSVIQDNYDQWFLVTALTTGVLQAWEAGDEMADGTAECKVPLFDPKTYIPLAFLHVANLTGTDWTFGTTDFDDDTSDNVVTTYLQLTSYVMPHPDNWPN